MSALDGIEGLGAVRRAALIDAFGSESAVLAASLDELTSVEGIGPSVAERIQARARGAATTSDDKWNKWDGEGIAGAAVVQHDARGQPPPAGPTLIATGITVRFGGLVAVSSLDLRAPGGRITGLIGPNGAGKSTTFDAISGVVKPYEGTVQLGDLDLSRRAPEVRARMGLGRTFQRIELCDSMTVWENVALGPTSLFGGRRPWSQLVTGLGQGAATRKRTAAALDQCGISGLADRSAADLSTGQRRLVELGRAIASEFSFLMLDEPSSGLDDEETLRFGDILEELAAAGTGILLVEHDMALVSRVCDYVHVLDFGELIYEGGTADVLSSDIVRAAYLGSEAA